MRQRSLGPEAYESCIKDHVRTGVPPTRGDNTHPERCWRVYDIEYLEAQYHKVEYAELFKKATTVNAPELKGMLENIQKAFP